MIKTKLLISIGVYAGSADWCGPCRLIEPVEQLVGAQPEEQLRSLVERHSEMRSTSRETVNTTDPSTVDNEAERLLVSFRSPETDADGVRRRV